MESFHSITYAKLSSSCTPTGILEEHLHGIGADTIVVAGCNFPNCPRTTIYEASERDFRVVLVTDAVSGLYKQGARELASIGVTLMTSNDLIRWCSMTRHKASSAARSAAEQGERQAASFSIPWRGALPYDTPKPAACPSHDEHDVAGY